MSRVKRNNPGKGVAPLHLSVVAIEKGAFWSPSTMVPNFTYLVKWNINFSWLSNATLSLSLYIYIYIVIHRQICFVLSELFSVARQAKFLKLGSKPGWLKHQSKILPLSHEDTSPSEGNLNAYVSQLLLFTYIRLTATESSIHMKSLALR